MLWLPMIDEIKIGVIQLAEIFLKAGFIWLAKLIGRALLFFSFQKGELHNS
jgi:hypothetical protein